MWKKLDVIGPECEISSEGVIRQKRVIKQGVELTDQTRKTYRGYKGRYTVTFRQEKEQQNRQVHILYAMAFCGNDDKEKKLHVIALDDDYSNLTPENIKWVAAVDLPPRETARVSKLTDEQKAELRGRIAAGGEKQYALAKEYGVSESLVSRIKA